MSRKLLAMLFVITCFICSTVPLALGSHDKQTDHHSDKISTSVSISDLYVGNPGEKPNKEYVTITNTGKSAVNMKGWKITNEGAKRTYVFPSYTLKSKSSVPVYTGKRRNTANSLFWGTDHEVWNDNGDTAYLYDARGNFVNSYASETGNVTETETETEEVTETETEAEEVTETETWTEEVTETETETEEVTETETEIEDITDSDKITVYVVPAITDNKILPKSSIPSSYISNTISVKASPGEFEPASFVIRADQDINFLTIESMDLTGSGGTIPSADVDIRTVKCWYQGGKLSNWDISVKGRYLTPELLLKDDALVKVTGEDWTQWDSSNPKGKNELKLASGSYIDISRSTPQQTDYLIVPISERSVSDAVTLQPVNIQNGYNKQFWVTFKVPDNANAGNYRGTITLRTGGAILQTLQLNLQVLPIVLSKPNLEYSLYYRGMITDDGSISSETKTVQQFTYEMQDLLNHGVTNPKMFDTDDDDVIIQMMSIRHQIGMDNTNFYSGLTFNDAGNIAHYKSILAPYGVSEIFVYGPDEEDLDTTRIRSKMTDVHNAGGKVMNAEYILEYGSNVADILDLLVSSELSDGSDIELVDLYHSYGNKVYSYSNPQSVPEFPRVFRLNYGLLMWQYDYDGVMDYAYQHSYGDIWNDFDYSTDRDHVFAYPTMSGSIGTIQWEGFREGVDDMRYLTALQNTIKSAKSQGKDTSEAERWLVNLKKSNLATLDLDAVRLQMIDYILSLQN